MEAIKNKMLIAHAVHKLVKSYFNLVFKKEKSSLKKCFV